MFTVLLTTLFMCSLNAWDLANFGGNNPFFNSQKRDYSNDRGGNSQYYNSQQNDYSNDLGGNDRNYNAQDNKRGEIYGDSNSYRGANGMIYNK